MRTATSKPRASRPSILVGELRDILGDGGVADARIVRLGGNRAARRARSGRNRMTNSTMAPRRDYNDMATNVTSRVAPKVALDNVGDALQP